MLALCLFSSTASETYKDPILASSPHSLCNARITALIRQRNAMTHRGGVSACSTSLLTSRRLICLLVILVHTAFSFGTPVLPNLALSVARLNASAPVHCTNHPGWMGKGYSEKHCYTALDNFYAREVLVHKGERFEWLARGQRPIGRDVVWTPKVYIVGKNYAPASCKRLSRADLEYSKNLACLLSLCLVVLRVDRYLRRRRARCMIARTYVFSRLQPSLPYCSLDYKTCLGTLLPLRHVLQLDGYPREEILTPSSSTADEFRGRLCRSEASFGELYLDE